jgi:hypothetical protein
MIRARVVAERNSSIAAAAERARVRVDQKESRVRLWIVDNGIGLPIQLVEGDGLHLIFRGAWMCVHAGLHWPLSQVWIFE